VDEGEKDKTAAADAKKKADKAEHEVEH